MSTVRELLTRWGFEVDDTPLKKIDDGVKTIGYSLGIMSAGFAAAGTAMGFFLNRAGDFEQTTIAFETMLGSADKATKTLSEIKEFTKTTPFELKDTLIGAKRLLAYNIEAEKLIPTLTSLGNIAAGVGRERLPYLILALGQVKTATKLRGQELRQFTEAGVPLIAALAEQFGKKESEIFDMISRGQVTFEDVEKAITKLTTGSGKFADLMHKQSLSFLGIWSNIKDTLNILSIEIGTQLLPIGKEYLSLTLDWLKVNSKFIKLGFAHFFENFSKSITLASKVIKSIIVFTEDLVHIFGGLEDIVTMLGKAFLITFSAATVYGIGQVTLGIFSLISAFKKLGIVGLIGNISAFIIPVIIGAGVIALLAALEDLFSFIRDRGTLIEDFLLHLGIPREKIEELRVSLQKLAHVLKEASINLFDALLKLFGDSSSEKAGKNVDENIKRLERMIDVINKLSSAVEKFGKLFNSEEEFSAAIGVTPEERAKLSKLNEGVKSGTPAAADFLKNMGSGGTLEFNKTEKDSSGNVKRYALDQYGNKIFSDGSFQRNPDNPTLGESLKNFFGFGQKDSVPVKSINIENMPISVLEALNPQETAQAIADMFQGKLREAARDSAGQVAE